MHSCHPLWKMRSANLLNSKDVATGSSFLPTRPTCNSVDTMTWLVVKFRLVIGRNKPTYDWSWWPFEVAVTVVWRHVWHVSCRHNTMQSLQHYIYVHTAWHKTKVTGLSQGCLYPCQHHFSRTNRHICLDSSRRLHGLLQEVVTTRAVKLKWTPGNKNSGAPSGHNGVTCSRLGSEGASCSE